MTVTPQQIADLRQLREWSTPGEWYDSTPLIVIGEDRQKAFEDISENDYDAAFACKAANLAIPLCDEIERLRAENERLRAAIKTAFVYVERVGDANVIVERLMFGLGAALERKEGA